MKRRPAAPTRRLSYFSAGKSTGTRDQRAVPFIPRFLEGEGARRSIAHRSCAPALPGPPIIAAIIPGSPVSGSSESQPLFAEAIERFTALWREARECASWEPDATTLATATEDGLVSARTVLLKQAGPEGFVFYTNYESRKSRDLAANPHAALCFFWAALRRQVIVQGRAVRLREAESDAYFAGRDRLAQLGAWASAQSQPLASHAVLKARLAELERRYEGRPVPRPPYWGGYRLVPDLIEFWAPGEGRLNERERYWRDADSGAWRFGLFNP